MTLLRRFFFLLYPIVINIYTIWILYLMFFIYDRDIAPVEKLKINFFPFQSILYLIEIHTTKWELWSNLLGNVILFAPYGFLGILYPKLNNYRNLFICFFLSINYLEFSQYFFKRGYAEFDDVMLNTIGMSLGYWLYKKYFFKNSVSE